MKQILAIKVDFKTELTKKSRIRGSVDYNSSYNIIHLNRWYALMIFNVIIENLSERSYVSKSKLREI